MKETRMHRMKTAQYFKHKHKKVQLWVYVLVFLKYFFFTQYCFL